MISLSLKDFIAKYEFEYCDKYGEVAGEVQKSEPFAGQCASLVHQYLSQCLNDEKVYGNAVDYVKCGTVVKEAKPGYLAVYFNLAKPYGHVGICVNENEMFDQNPYRASIRGFYALPTFVKPKNYDKFFTAEETAHEYKKGRKMLAIGKLTNKTTRCFWDGEGDVVRYYIIQGGDKTTVRCVNEPQAVNLAWATDTPVKEHGSIDDFYQVLWALGARQLVKKTDKYPANDWEGRHELGHVLFDFPCGNQITF